MPTELLLDQMLVRIARYRNLRQLHMLNKPRSAAESYTCTYCGLRRYHLPGQHDQCDHSPTGDCVDPAWEKKQRGRSSSTVRVKGKFTPKVDVSVKRVMRDVPRPFLTGLTLESSAREGSMYSAGTIRVDSRDVGEGIEYSSSDLDGRAVIARTYLPQRPGTEKYASVVDNVGAHMARQIVAHEIGHHVQNSILDQREKGDLDRILDRHWKGVTTANMGRYRSWDTQRSADVEDTGGLDTSNVRARRLKREAFAEAFRLKATRHSDYNKRVPKQLRLFIDKIWRKNSKR